MLSGSIPARYAIETVYWRIGRGNLIAVYPGERFNYFPTDEPLADMFEIDVDRDGGADLVCPCGERMPLATWVDDLKLDIETHIRNKHPEKVTS